MAEPKPKAPRGDKKKVRRLLFYLLWAGIMAALAVNFVPRTFWAMEAWLVLMAFSTPSFMVSVPEVTGLVAVNHFTGRMVIYGTGLFFRFPWEQVRIGNYINLRLVTKGAEEDYPSKTSKMHAKWSFQYEPMLDYLDRYIAADATTIIKGLQDVGSSILSREIRRRSADDCKDQQEKIEASLVQEYEDEAVKKLELHPRELYGVDIKRVSLSDLDFTAAVQAAKDAEEAMKRIQATAADIKKKHPQMSDKEVWNRALAANNLASLEVFDVEGEAGSALSGLILAAARGRGGNESKGKSKEKH